MTRSISIPLGLLVIAAAAAFMYMQSQQRTDAATTAHGIEFAANTTQPREVIIIDRDAPDAVKLVRGRIVMPVDSISALITHYKLADIDACHALKRGKLCHKRARIKSEDIDYLRYTAAPRAKTAPKKAVK